MSLPAASGPDFVPEAYPAERYQPLWKKSPFTLSSAAAEGPAAGFSQDLALSGISVIGGKSYAWLLDKKTSQRRMLSGEPDADGFVLESISNDPDLSKVSAVIRKGGETATVKYDFEHFNQAVASAAPVPVPPPQTQTHPRVNPRTPPTPGKVVPRRIIIPSRPK